jgi:hypothetical protein
MRVLKDLPPESLREIVNFADADPEADLTQRILEEWLPAAFSDRTSMRLLASIAAVQCLQVNLKALGSADDWLSGLDDEVFASIIEEQIRRGQLRFSANKKSVDLIRFARLAFNNNKQLQAICGCADGEALRVRYVQRLVTMFGLDRPEKASGITSYSITDRIDAALALFNAGFLRGSFEQLIAANMRDGNERPQLASAVEAADRLFETPVHGHRINQDVVQLIIESFDPLYDRTCAERIAICRILRKFACDYDHSVIPSKHDVTLLELLIGMLKNWWSGSAAIVDAAVAAEALVASATLRHCLRSGSEKSDSVAEQFLKEISDVTGVSRHALSESDALLVPALVQSMTILGESVYAWKNEAVRNRYFGHVGDTWFELSILIRDDAQRKDAPLAGALIDMRKPNQLGIRPTLLDIGALIRLICARGDVGNLRHVDSKIQFNPNLLFWLGWTLDHRLLCRCAVELRRYCSSSYGDYQVAISARAASQRIKELVDRI